MLPRLLSFAIPLSVYASLVLVVWGVYRGRAKFDRWGWILGALAFIASLAFRPSEHQLFFDEDIYIQIASNLSHQPVAQLTLFGGPGDIQSSAYYKEPAGFPVLLSLVFIFTGTKEKVAFVVARVLFGLAVVGVYALARELSKARGPAIAAAVTFAAAPACFAYSASTGTDLAAGLFATLGVLGIVTGNGMLAASGLAMAAQVRLEMIAIVPLILLAKSVPLKWKGALAALLVGEVLHIRWVLSVAPSLARVEHVNSAFALSYVWGNLWANIRYLFDPRAFPIVAILLAIAGITRRADHRWILAAWFAILFAVYLCFYAGSFALNPRYSIQIAIPLILMAASFSTRLVFLAPLVIAAILPGSRPWSVPPYLQTLTLDHRFAERYAETLGPNDLAVTTEPEIFLIAGKHAMNASFAAEKPDRLNAQMGRFDRIVYYAGVRTSVEDSEQWTTHRVLSSAFKLTEQVSRKVNGMSITVYEVQGPTGR